MMSTAEMIKRLRAIEVNAAMVMNEAATMRQELELADKVPAPRKGKKSKLTAEQINQAFNRRLSRIKVV